MKKLFFALALLALGFGARAGVEIDDRLPAGNVIVDGIEGDTVLVRQDLSTTDRNGWFYWAFRVKGAAGRTLTFDFRNGYHTSVGPRGPVVTLDRGKTYSYPCDKDGAAKHPARKFTYAFPKDADEVWFYETWQYLPPEWEAFLAAHSADRGRKFATGVLCKSRKGRVVPNARFGCIGRTPKYRIFMSSRHHCSEATATPVLEGVAAAFLSDDDLGRWLCANVELMLVPFVDYDGVVDGDQGKNRPPHDHNRDYTEFTYPETRAIRDWIADHAGGRIDVFIDVHCPWIRDGNADRSRASNEFLYTPWKDPKIVPDAASEARYSELLEQLQCGSMRYRAADDIAFGRLWNTGENYSQGWSAVIWACHSVKGLRIARSYEVPFANANGAVVTPETCRELGRDTAKVFRAFFTGASARSSIVLECEAFADLGGWTNDSQFMDQMGSPYLLAHGLGRPVAEAKTSFRAEAGRYSVWVRTKDWTAPWAQSGEGAGRFTLSVNGKTLPQTLGVQGDGKWLWTKAGEVELANGENEVALHDLTGFDGRCDAVVFTAADQSCPDLDELRKSKSSAEVTAKTDYDLVVVGGGIAGICAAVTASRLGLRTALVHDRPVLGGNNSSEVRVHLGGYQNLPPYPRLGDVLAEFAPGQGGNARPAANYADERKLAIVKAEANLDLCLEEHVDGVDAKDGRIFGIHATHVRTGIRRRIRGRLFADCTGDGTVGVLAGADYRQGREARSEQGESLAPEQSDAMTMGASVQWYAVTNGASSFPSEKWMLAFDERSAKPGLRGDWDWETGLGRDQVSEAERIRDYGLLVVYSNWSYLKNGFSRKAEFAQTELAWVASVAGKRESRRLMGDYVLSQRDLDERRIQDDGTCVTTWTIDQHHPWPESHTGFRGEPFQAESRNRMIWPYPIPYRCLYSRNVANLFMAGRDISVTHVALGTTRLMRTHGMMGEVVGMAAAVCRLRECEPRQVYSKHFEDLRSLMTTGVGDGREHPRQDYNCQGSLDPEIRKNYLAGRRTGLPYCVDGIYPHLAMFNGEGECGTGAVVPWAGSLWAVTYGPHCPLGSTDRLYEITPDLKQIIHPESVGGTPANRLIHRETNQLLIGPYVIDAKGKVRVIPPKKMPGRLTGAARHLSDPANLVYVATMDNGLYELDMNTLAVKTVLRDHNWVDGKIWGRKGLGPAPLPDWSAARDNNLPGSHTKGMCTGFGRIQLANNGEYHPEAKTNPWIPSGVLGDCAPDGSDQRVIRRCQFTDIATKDGICGNEHPDSNPIWSLGWDAKSVILAVTTNGTDWAYYRLPKGSHCYDGAHGWNTEWPRIRDVGFGDGTLLATMHGTFWKFPADFSPAKPNGIRPLSTYLKVIGDFCRWRDCIVFGCDDQAKNEFLGTRTLKKDAPKRDRSQSNLWFVKPEELTAFGPPSGEGWVWLKEDVKKGAVSDPFLSAGYETTDFSFTDAEGKPVAHELIREGDWVRVKALRDVKGANARFEYGPKRPAALPKYDGFVEIYDDYSRKTYRFPNVNGDKMVICREVATERDILYAGGVFYEVPADNAGGFEALRPIALADGPVRTIEARLGLVFINGKPRAVDSLWKNGTASAAYWLWRSIRK